MDSNDNPFGNDFDYFPVFNTIPTNNVNSQNISSEHSLKRKRENLEENPREKKQAVSETQLTQSLQPIKTDQFQENSELVIVSEKKEIGIIDNNNDINVSTNNKENNLGTTVKYIQTSVESNMVQLIEDIKIINISSIATYTKDIIFSRKDEIIIPQNIKCIFGNLSVKRTISDLKFSFNEGVSFLLHRTPEEKIKINISRSQLQDDLKGIYIALKPIVLILEMNKFDSLKDIINFSSNDQRIFIRLPQDFPDQDLEKIIANLKTIIYGPQDDKRINIKNVEIQCIHNRDFILLVKGEAKSYKDCSTINHSKIPKYLRTAFKIESLIVTFGDINRLDPEQFLNDNIVDYYMKDIFSRLPEDLKNRCYFFNSQFYPLISSKHMERASLRIPSQQIRIFEKDFIFIPICDHVHWTLCIVCFPRNSGVLGCGDETARIEYCDSLGTINTSALSLIRNYLRLRWNVENPNAGPKVFIPRTIPEHLADLPKQSNNSDCGVYMLCYIEKFLETMPELPLVIPDWFSAQDVLFKRYEIKNKAMKLHRMYVEDEFS